MTDGFKGGQGGGLFTAGQPFTLVNEQYQLATATSLNIAGSLLEVAAGGILAAHLAVDSVLAVSIKNGEITPAKMSTTFTGSHIPFSDADPTSIASRLTSVLRADGTIPMAASFDLNTNKLINVVAPTAATDGANKAYTDDLVNTGIRWLAPSFGNQEQTWGLRAGMAFSMEANPSNLDYFTVQGLDFTFVTGAPAAATEIQIGGGVAATLAAAVIRMNACASLTDIGSAFNVEFDVFTANTKYLFISCKTEDPPNTPSDGNSRTAVPHSATFLVAWGFRSGVELSYSDLGTTCYITTTGGVSTLQSFEDGIGWSNV